VRIIVEVFVLLTCRLNQDVEEYRVIVNVVLVQLHAGALTFSQKFRILCTYRPFCSDLSPFRNQPPPPKKNGKLSECHVRLISPLGAVGRSAFSLSSQLLPRRGRTRIMYSDGLWICEGWEWRAYTTVRGCSTEGDFWAVMRTVRGFAQWVQCAWQNVWRGGGEVVGLDLWRNEIGDIL